MFDISHSFEGILRKDRTPHCSVLTYKGFTNSSKKYRSSLDFEERSCYTSSPQRGGNGFGGGSFSLRGLGYGTSYELFSKNLTFCSNSRKTLIEESPFTDFCQINTTKYSSSFLGESY